MFYLECSGCSLRSKLERLLAVRKRFADARPLVLHSGRFLSVIERSRDEGLLLVLNSHPERTIAASIAVSPALLGKRLVRDGLGETHVVSSNGFVFVEAPAGSYVLYVTEPLHVAAPLLRPEELVSSSRIMSGFFPAREKTAWRGEVPLGWVEALLGAA